MSLLLSILFWLMVALIFAAIGIFIDRMLRLRKISIDAQDFLWGVFAVLDKGQLREARAICDETPGPVPALVREVLEHRTSKEPELRLVLQSVAQMELQRVERRSLLLVLLGQMLPLLGLLGTFVGGYVALRGLDLEAPLVQVGSVSSAAALALLTTVVGLIGAILCTGARHFIRIRIESLALAMDMTEARMLEYLSRHSELGELSDEA